MRWFAVVVSLIAGCNSQSGEEPGPTSGSPSESTADPGAGSGLVWVDATGAEVQGVFFAGAQPLYLDGNGAVWRLDLWSADPTVAFQPVDQLAATNYSDEDCNDPWISTDDPPGFTIALTIGSGAPSTSVVVLPPDITRDHLDKTYKRDGNYCEKDATSQSFDGFPVSSTRPATTPQVTWTPPLHPEWR